MKPARRRATGIGQPDWWDVRRQLQKEWLAELGQIPMPSAAELQALRQTWEASLTYACLAYLDGDPSLLLAYLRSGRSLSSQQARDLADCLEDQQGKPQARQRGRVKDTGRHFVTRTAKQFYLDWQRLNKELGISSWGHAEDMKKEGIRFVREEYLPQFSFVDADAALDLISRPKSRQ